MTMVATETANSALLLPSLLTMTWAIFSAAPVLINAPARIPDVMILSTDVIMLPAPVIMVETVRARSPYEPITPPIKAPMMRL